MIRRAGACWAMPRPGNRRDERGQALLLALAACSVILLAALALVAYGRGLRSRGGYQRVADLAVLSAARVMRTTYPRLFQPALIDGVPNPAHMSRAQYLALARAAAGSAAVRNGMRLHPGAVTFPDGASFAPTRVSVALHGAPPVRVGSRTARVPLLARATAAIVPAAGPAAFPTVASGGGGEYAGPLAYRQGKPMRPDVAQAFDRLAEAARREAGLGLVVVSGFRSDEEQARLFAGHPDPHWVARPGESLHRYATELDLGPSSAYGWLARNARRFGFVKRYSWEPWHFGYGSDLGAAPRASAARASVHGVREHALPSFVPARWEEPLARAALRWNVPVELLAAQLYAESAFNPFATSPAGAEGIAQFVPGTARALGLTNPYDALAAIDAQARLMHSLLARFGSFALALAAYNAGSAPVQACHCVPDIPETQAYVARILGLMGGAGELATPPLEVRLVA